MNCDLTTPLARRQSSSRAECRGWRRPFRGLCSRKPVEVLAIAILVSLFGGAGPVLGVHESRVVDDHPAGGPGATGSAIIVPGFGQPGSPLFEGPEAPGIPHLHGPWPGNVSPGHADPHDLDPAHYLGHGIGVPIEHGGTPPPGGELPGGGLPPGGESPGAPASGPSAVRDVALREVVIPLDTSGEITSDSANLAAFFGEAGFFDVLFTRPRPDLSHLRARGPNTATAAPAAPNQTLIQAEQRLAEAEQAHAQALAALGTQRSDAHNALEAAQRDKAIAQGKLDARSTFATVAGQFDGSAAVLEDQIAAADQRIKTYGRQFIQIQNEIDTTAQHFADQEHKLRLAVIKADPAALARETDVRVQELIVLNKDFSTRTAQTRAGAAAYRAEIADRDSKIAQANAVGNTDEAAQAADDKQKVVAAFDQWTDYRISYTHKAVLALNVAYARNQADGIGPADGYQFADELARRRVTFSAVAGADQEAVAATAASALAQAEGAPATTEHISIFVNVADPRAWASFGVEVVNTQIEHTLNPKLYLQRSWAYARGVGGAVKDGVVDLAVLGVEIADTSLELQQQAFNQAFGTDIDLVGTENLEFMQAAGAKVSELDSAALFTTVDRFVTYMDRRFEQAAGSGEKGIQQALETTGYVFTTIIGGEEIAFRAVVIAGKGVKIVRLGAADEALAAGADLSRSSVPVGDAGGAVSGKAGTLPPPVGEGTPTPVVSAGPGVAAGAPNAAAAPPPARGPPDAGGMVPRAPTAGAALGQRADGTKVLKTPDGREYEFGERLGGGLTSEAFAVPNQNVVIKITRPHAGNSIVGARFDAAGYQVINSIDPNLAPRQLSDTFVINGEQYAIFERADPYQQTRFRQAMDSNVTLELKLSEKTGDLVADLEKIAVEMTPGQALAYKTGMDKLNDARYVLMDGKIDNWALVKVGEPDVWQLKIIDPGSMVKMTSADAAHSVRRKIDDANEELMADYLKGGQMMKRGIMVDLRGEIATEFDPLIDKDGMRALGVPITSFGEVPFNPVHGFQNPSVRQIYDVDIAKMTDQEFIDFLRSEGWTDGQIEELVDLPPASRADSVRLASQQQPGAGLAPPSPQHVHPRMDGELENMTGEEYANFLRSRGWDEAKIADAADGNPVFRGDDVRATETRGDHRGDASDGPTPESGQQAEMSDEAFADKLRREDPAYWTEERIREYLDYQPEPAKWADEAADAPVDDVPTQLDAPAAGSNPMGAMNQAVSEADAAHAGTPTLPPPRFSARDGAKPRAQWVAN